MLLTMIPAQSEGLSTEFLQTKPYASAGHPVWLQWKFRGGSSAQIMQCSIFNTAAHVPISSSYLGRCNHSFYGLLLDNTKELRKTLEDGNSVIDTINDLRGAECTEPSFDPPTAKPARITGG